MIPKVIHYCWFGGKNLPRSAERCIESWRKFLPDYKIRRWDESNFPIDEIEYTAQAYKDRKYAFVSDYARFKILYEYGGLYFDTDVEIIRNMDDIVAAGPFMGCEGSFREGQSPMRLAVATGLGLGAEPGMELYSKLIELYKKLEYVRPNGKAAPDTVVTHVTRLLVEEGLENSAEPQRVGGVTVYPVDYFCPISVGTGKLIITQNTRSIHHYDQTWQSPSRRIGRKLVLALGGQRLKKVIKKIVFRER